MSFRNISGTLQFLQMKIFGCWQYGYFLHFYNTMSKLIKYFHFIPTTNLWLEVKLNRKDKKKNLDNWVYLADLILKSSKHYFRSKITLLRNKTKVTSDAVKITKLLKLIPSSTFRTGMLEELNRYEVPSCFCL